MSIAVSAIVRSSPLLARVDGCMCALVILTGLLLPGGDFRLPFWLGAACIAAGLSAILSKNKSNALRIDISGVGQIWLTVYQCMGAASPARPATGTGEAVRLMAGSTLWPHLLLLRFGTADGKVIVVPVLPDSIAPPLFLALAVACRAIAARKDEVL
jgi:toxin CptA